MTTPQPAPAPAPAAPRAAPVRPRRRWGRFLGLVLLLFSLAVGALFIPSVFQFALRELLTIEAWRHGSHIELAKVDGSFSEPVRLEAIRWTFNSHAGSKAVVEIEEAEATFDWPAALPWHGGRWFNKLALKGVLGKVEIPVAAVRRDFSTPSSTPGALRVETVVPQWWPAPRVVSAEAVDLTIITGENWTRIQQSRWMISELDAGFVEAGQISVKQPWLDRTFRDVHGETRLQASQLLIADLRLDKDVLVTSATADLTKFAKGVLDLDLQIDAFGGKIRTQAETLPREREVQVSSTTTFLNINVASLATFLGVSEAAGGSIEEGKFNFRGALSDLPGANCSLRFTARNFQWESRQWDSLVLGATLAGHRVQIPEFELRQGQNELSLSGEFALPKPGTPWWQTEFAVNLAGRIDNLTDLSALLLPDFQYAAGKATIDGSIRGRDQQFHGQLIVSGSDITWRKAPIKELHAALRLNGNELQLANLDLINRDDYVHGRGVINILGAKQYWGEVRASVEDLAIYSSLLQKPLVPEPLAGGAVVNWSGEGSAARYSGSFFARLQKLRSLGKTGTQLHPVNAELEGAYAPGALQFSRFAVTDDNSSFSAKVQVGQKTVSVSEIQLKQGMETRLEGNATLPFDVWSAWPGGDLAQFLCENTPAQFKLKAKNLRLAEAMRLSGWNWPVDGGVSGEIAGQGAGAALQMQGGLELREGKLPLGWHGDVLTGVSAEVALAGHALSLTKFEANHPSGQCTASGQIDLQAWRDPVFDLKVESKAVVPLLQGWKVAKPAPAFGAAPLTLGDPPLQTVDLRAECQGRFELKGPSRAAAITGSVVVDRFALRPLAEAPNGAEGQPPKETPVDVQPIWTTPSAELPPLFAWADRPWASCQLDVRCSTKPPAPGLANSPADQLFWNTNLHLTGTGAAPKIEGSLKLVSSAEDGKPPAAEAAALPITSGGFPLRVTSGSVIFRPGAPLDPTVDFTFEGKWQGVPFHASILGPMSHRIVFIDSEEARQYLLSGASWQSPEAALPPAFGIHVNRLSAQLPTPSAEPATLPKVPTPGPIPGLPTGAIPGLPATPPALPPPAVPLSSPEAKP